MPRIVSDLGGTRNSSVTLPKPTDLNLISHELSLCKEVSPWILAQR